MLTTFSSRTYVVMTYIYIFIIQLKGSPKSKKVTHVIFLEFLQFQNSKFFLPFKVIWTGVIFLSILMPSFSLSTTLTFLLSLHFPSQVLLRTLHFSASSNPRHLSVAALVALSLSLSRSSSTNVIHLSSTSNALHLSSLSLSRTLPCFRHSPVLCLLKP